ncbi:MAG: Stp1/IreP family PP2C-type Ser/Thr phosphatase [Hydrogenoanaerobacterium sp.]
MVFKAYGKTDKGRVRENNQDYFTVKNLSDEVILAVVCDGMGGERGGNIASRNAVNIISQNICSNYRDIYDENGIRNMMMSAVSVANALVHDMAVKDENLRGMGTTVIVCVLKNGMAHILHAGDSRVYIGDEKGVTRLTRDHSVVQMLIETGELTEEEAAIHPKKHYITRALGVEPELDAEYGEYLLKDGNRLLLCTDGLTNHLSADEIAKELMQNPPEDIPQRLIDTANKKGGSDNITAVVLL